MEIIEELEPVRRSFYGGCVGYFGFNGNLEMAITIRSALLKDGVVTVQAGGGIVADSVPEMEYKEIQNKARAMIKAIELCS
jgi:anthranilate synthase component 1